MMGREISLLCLKFCLYLVEITLSTKTVALSLILIIQNA